MVRDEVIRVATRLFKEKGIRGVSLQAIADEVGLTKGALYHYFSGRDDLLRQVVGDWITQEFESVRDLVSSSGTATEQLRAYVRYHVSSVANNLDLYSLTYSSESEFPADIQDEFRKLKRQSDTLLKSILSQGVAEGEFEVRDEKIIAFAIDGMCNWLWQWYTPDGPKAPEDVADTYIDLLLRGMLRSSDDESPAAAQGTQSPADQAEYHARSIRFHTERLEAVLPSLTAPVRNGTGKRSGASGSKDRRV
ncbi:hypothetical protein ASD81_19185 [Nocardioides sp. Root614]|nr:hypothetical protein ASD81_19185 [Nocardioides sp. Root614]KRA86762.1 hypothetical protein ASD84_21410 [Nocardioides sp. Root682]